jgi:hypothetical protein
MNLKAKELQNGLPQVVEKKEENSSGMKEGEFQNGNVSRRTKRRDTEFAEKKITGLQGGRTSADSHGRVAWIICYVKYCLRY